MAITSEGRVVRIADIMAYLNHDLDDALRSGVITTGQVPGACSKIMGRTHSERATQMIRDLIFTSRVVDGELALCMSDEMSAAMSELRTFLYDNVYRSRRVHKEFIKARKILTELYTFFLENKAMLEKEMADMELSVGGTEKSSCERVVCDFIASITDRNALNLYEKIFFPSPLV